MSESEAIQLIVSLTHGDMTTKNRVSLWVRFAICRHILNGAQNVFSHRI
jgi:hypothetical protein